MIHILDHLVCTIIIFSYKNINLQNCALKKMIEYTIPSSTWVIFECNGNFKESIQTIFRKFLTEWLPFSNYEYAGLPDMEIYPITKSNIIAGHSEVWIVINKVNE